MLTRLLLISLFFVLVQAAYSQSSKQDSITHRYDSLSKVKLNKLDSSNNRTNKKIDSVQRKVNNILNPDLSRLSIKEGKRNVENRKTRKDSIEFYKSLNASKEKLKLKIDSLEKNGMPSQHYALQLDSLNKLKYKPATDSSAIKRNTAKQEINKQQGKLNSILNPDLNSLSHSGQSKLQKRKAKRDSIVFAKQLEAEKLKLSDKIDSLQKSGLPVEEYTLQLDSLNKIKYQTSANKQASLTHKLNSIKSVNPTQQLNGAQQKINGAEQKITAPADKIENGVNEKLSLMNKEGGAGANLPDNITTPNSSLPTNQLPNASLPGTSLPSTPDLKTDLKIDNPVKDQLGDIGEVKDKIAGAQNLPQQQVSKLKSIDEVKDVQSKLGAANQITDKAQSYSGEVKKITKGDLSEVKELPKAAETQAGKLGMNEFQKETGQFDQYKQVAEKAKDPKALKEEVLKQAPKLAVNHFAGKEAVLQQAMEKMDKLKTKYSEFNSLSELKKRSNNTMKGKPFIERIAPGITLQIQKSGDVLVDYNPYVGYRFYGRFTAGAGWNERFSIGKHFHFLLNDRIYGPRVFADFKIGKGFSVRTDIEKMNTYVPAITTSGYSTDTEYRAWVWSAFVGLKKEYKFMKGVKGNAQFLYNLYDDHNNSPYGDRFAVRMGFEFQLKKKPVKHKSL